MALEKYPVCAVLPHSLPHTAESIAIVSRTIGKQAKGCMKAAALSIAPGLIAVISSAVDKKSATSPVTRALTEIVNLIIIRTRPVIEKRRSAQTERAQASG